MSSAFEINDLLCLLGSFVSPDGRETSFVSVCVLHDDESAGTYPIRIHEVNQEPQHRCTNGDI